MKLARTLPALVLFGVSFAYVEAAVVVYLRTILEPIREVALSGVPHDDLFPLLSVGQLRAAGPHHIWLLWTELGREAATMVMLAAAGLAVAGNFRQWLAGFVIAFGVWDIFFYAFLRLLIGWPASLGTWDVLFLIPVPWTGPVIAPILVAAAMTLAGTSVLRREARGRPIGFGWIHWATIFGGGLVLVVAFCWDAPNTMAGGLPKPFNWPLFALGLATGGAGFLHAALRAPAEGLMGAVGARR